MVTKTEAKSAFQQLFSDWGREIGRCVTETEDPSFSDFRDWVRAKGYAHYFEFRSVRGAVADVEDWFDRHFHQSWRN